MVKQDIEKLNTVESRWSATSQMKFITQFVNALRSMTDNGRCSFGIGYTVTRQNHFQLGNDGENMHISLFCNKHRKVCNDAQYKQSP